MNVKRFTARTAREALVLVRKAFGDDAAVLSTRPCAEGVEVLAMAPDSLAQLDRVSAEAPHVDESSFDPAPAPTAPEAAPASPRGSFAARISQGLPDLKQTLVNAIRPRARSHWSGAAHDSVPAASRIEPNLEGFANTAPPTLPPRLSAPGATVQMAADHPEDSVAQDVGQLSMSTLSFQDYVRERMERRRGAPQRGGPLDDDAADLPMVPTATSAGPAAPALMAAPQRPAAARQQAPRPAPMQPAQPGARGLEDFDDLPRLAPTPAPAATRTVRAHAVDLADELPPAPLHAAEDDEIDPPVVRRAARSAEPPLADVTPLRASRARREPAPRAPSPVTAPSLAAARHDDADPAVLADAERMLGELRSVRGLIEGQLGAIAMMERLKRSPKQAALTRQLLYAGFSPGLTRRLIDSLPEDVDDEIAWASRTLQDNLQVEDASNAVEEGSGVVALIGSTGVGKTTCTAKLAANFAARHGAQNLGLITLDAYRVGAHEQLRAYGRILGVPVHIAHDRASLKDLLDLLSGKRLVLIDTAGTAQRDSRTRDQLDMLRSKSIQKLLVVNAAQQGETLEDVLVAWKASACRGVVLSKVDEAVKLAPALDALIRHKLKVMGVANGQRVPEDWHHLSAPALVQRAMQAASGSAWRLDANDINLVVAGTTGRARRGSGAAAGA